MFCENFAVFPDAGRHALAARPPLAEAVDPYREQLRCFDEAPGRPSTG
jgi:hypothetical protein